MGVGSGMEHDSSGYMVHLNVWGVPCGGGLGPNVFRGNSFKTQFGEAIQELLLKAAVSVPFVRLGNLSLS
eukprot:768461-Amphidinium_carterae.1